MFTLQSQPIRLRPAFQRYDWGTQTAISELLNLARPPGHEPVAELWMGAHPALPSPLLTPVAGQTDLRALIAQAPEAMLGPRHAALGDRLPYLVKVLSAQRALSVQVHPDRTQAAAGFEAENAAGVALTDPARNYKDANHKPELLLALTEFHAMAGFRQPEAVAERLAQLAAPELQDWAVALQRRGTAALAELYAWVLQLSAGAVQALLASVLAQLPDGEDFQWVRRLHELFGDDPGVLFPLILHRFTLRPGEAIVLAAGVPHAYLEGTGLEVMASSDNVLRGGLTRKHMDVPELLRITRVEPDSVAIQAGETRQGATHWPVPFDEFQLTMLALAGGTAQTLGTSGSAELLLQLQGSSAVGSARLVQGDIVLLPAALGAVPIVGDGQLARVFTRLA